MGKSPAKLQDFARVISSNRLHRRPNTQIKPPSVAKTRPVSSPEEKEPPKLSAAFTKEQQLKLKATKYMGDNKVANSTSVEEQFRRTPLADVVADCVKRWFQDTLKDAKAGDVNMQVLVGQMYFSGYGVPVDVQKGKAWMNKASRTRASAWKVSEKRPGYNVSDSDSDSDDNQVENK